MAKPGIEYSPRGHIGMSCSLASDANQLIHTDKIRVDFGRLT
jgi:hypothetical protein